MDTKQLTVHETLIPGLLVIDLPVHQDARGWFKENWQREKMVALGLPDFFPVQNNVSYNYSRGVIRGVHAEPWDKLVSVVSGRVFGAWVDLREGDNFGATYALEVGPSTAIFVPYGVGNAYQALEDDTVYSYLVNRHWSADSKDAYTFVNLNDPQCNIPWPIKVSEFQISDSDLSHPLLDEVKPMKRRRTLVLGASGQLGKAIRELVGNDNEFDFADRTILDLASPTSLGRINWNKYDCVINAAAYTNVDKAEAQGRVDAWRVNAAAVAELSSLTFKHGIVLIHISTDYVFDGDVMHREDDQCSPLNEYGKSKFAGECAVQVNPLHYLVRTSWVIGDANNFVKTMANLAYSGASPSVVNDQHGRLTFATDLAAFLLYLRAARAEFGIYHFSNDGPEQSWFDIAQKVFDHTIGDAAKVNAVSTSVYAAGKELAIRPRRSTFSLEKAKSTGFSIPTQDTRLAEYLDGLEM